MFGGGGIYLIALTFLQLFTQINGQLPREIDEGPNGNIIINIGGIKDPRPSAFLQLKAKSRGIATRIVKNGESNAPSTIDARIGNGGKEEDYDYYAYTTKSAQMKNSEETPKPKKSKSKRPTLVQFLLGLVGGSALKREKNGGRKRTLSAGEAKAALGANQLQLFDENGQRSRPLSTLLTAENNQRPFLRDFDLPSSSLRRPLNSAVSMGHTRKISKERLSINEGCRSWKDFGRLTELKRPKLVEGNVKKPVESTEPLGNSETQSSSSLAVLGPSKNGVTKNELPLPECFLNQLGMACCNRVLEDLIFRANDAMINANVNKCNIEIFSELLKNIAEKQFQRTFEIVVANGDFASKIRFKDNLMCKTIANNKYVLIYATPEPYTLSPYNVQPPLIS